MKKVFQTVVDKQHGNCQQAVIASILDLELDQVPNFIEYEKDGDYEMTVMGWLSTRGYNANYVFRYRHDTDMLKKIAKFDGGVNGYFYASVPSQTFENGSHAVVVDIDLNIVHDPNPNQRALLLTTEDIEGLLIMNDIVIGKTGKLFTSNDWASTSEEERDLNTWKVKYDDNDKIIGTY